MKPYKLGEIVRFSSPDRKNQLNPLGWIDEFDNTIPYESLGIIIRKSYKREDDWTGWEYDILIPSLGLVSPNWGNFALKKLEDEL